MPAQCAAARLPPVSYLGFQLHHVSDLSWQCTLGRTPSKSVETATFWPLAALLTWHALFLAPTPPRLLTPSAPLRSVKYRSPRPSGTILAPNCSSRSPPPRPSRLPSLPSAHNGRQARTRARPAGPGLRAGRPRQCCAGAGPDSGRGRTSTGVVSGHFSLFGPFPCAPSTGRP